MERQRSYADYIKESKQMNSEDPFFKDFKRIKIAILSSYTFNNIKDVLAVKCSDNNIMADLYLADYKQYNQEILDPSSKLYIYEPDLIILNIDLMSLLGDIYYNPYSIEAAERKDLFSKKLEELTMLIRTIKQQLKSKILLHNFEIPAYSPYGILENKQSEGFNELIEGLNSCLRDFAKEDSQLFVFDFNGFVSKMGKDNSVNMSFYYLGDMKLSNESLIKLADEYVAYIKPMLAMSKKCLVLDLDNTLWGGIIGEDGMRNIKLGPENQGKPFYEFQKYIKALAKRGVMLAINSKNNLKDVEEVLDKHPYMQLKQDDFAAIYCNWQDKATNMSAIAKELNIGLDTLVFLDDDAMNCDLVKNMLPEVKVIHLPKNPADYVSILKGISDFNTLSITAEDKNKSEIYAQQRMRDQFSKKFTDMDSYLREMGISITIEAANDFNIPRISQLTLKTNQFNLTTRRYLEEDIRKFAARDDVKVLAFSVKDKFGDNGLVGILILEIKDNICRIDSFLMSCRVIGRKIEETMLNTVFKYAVSSKTKIVLGEFIPTTKNELAKDLYKNNGFKLVRKEGDKEIWERDSKDSIVVPDFIEVKENYVV